MGQGKLAWGPANPTTLDRLPGFALRGRGGPPCDRFLSSALSLFCFSSVLAFSPKVGPQVEAIPAVVAAGRPETQEMATFLTATPASLPALAGRPALTV